MVVDDLRDNRGRRIRHGLAWRLRRQRNRLLIVIGRARSTDQQQVYSAAFGERGERVLDRLKSGAKRDNLGIMFGGRSTADARIVHVAADDLDQFFGLLDEVLDSDTAFVRVRGEWRLPYGKRAVERLLRAPTRFEILVAESVVQGKVEQFGCSRLEVALWREKRGAYDQPYMEVNRSLPVVKRLRLKTYERLSLNAHDFDEHTPAPQPDFEIDIVYTWVDGNDEEWRRSKAHYQGAKASAPSRVFHDERFRNRDELCYSLRSVAAFAPWVRRIHIVTADQQPSWLNTDHPKINLVSHRDVYDDPSWLPTFNSSGIETQLHHVPGLARRFIYFNDDFFLGQLCAPRDFFHANGIVRYFPSDQRAYEPDIDRKSEEYIQADRNAIELLLAEGGTVGRQIMIHAPYASDRLLLEEMESKWSDAFAQCASSRFRSSNDVRPIAFMQYHYGYRTGRALPGRISHRYLALWKATVLEQMAGVARDRSFKTFCINDVGLQPERTDEVNRGVSDFLEQYFPTPSPFELTD